MNIPAFTWLAGFKINTVYDTTLCERKQFIGEAVYSKQQIVLDPSVATREQLEQTYIHELMHWVLYIMRDTRRSDEPFVDTIAHLLYQALTMKGDDDGQTDDVNP